MKEGKILDLGVEGARVQTSLEIPEGSQVRMRVNHPQLGVLNLAGQAPWRMPSPDGDWLYGIRFDLDMPANEIDLLGKYVITFLKEADTAVR
jgi:hypothetical protein